MTAPNIYKTRKYSVNAGQKASLSDEIFVENQINKMANNGWKYVNSMVPGSYGFVLLVFRRPK